MQEEKRFTLIRNAINDIHYETEHADRVVKYLSKVPIDESKLLEPTYVSTIKDSMPAQVQIPHTFTPKKIEFKSAIDEMRNLNLEDVEPASELDFDARHKYNHEQLKKLQGSLNFVTRRMITKNKRELSIASESSIPEEFLQTGMPQSTTRRKKSYLKKKALSVRGKHQPSIDEFLKNGGMENIEVTENDQKRGSVFLLTSTINTVGTSTPTINIIPSEAVIDTQSQFDFKTFEMTQPREMPSPIPTSHYPGRTNSIHSTNFLEVPGSPTRLHSAPGEVRNTILKVKKEEEKAPHERKQALKGTINEILYQSKHADNDDLKSKAISKVKKLMMVSKQGKHVRYPDEKLITRERYNVDITTMVSPKKVMRMVKHVKNEFFRQKVEEIYDPYHGNKLKAFIHLNCKQITKDCERAIKSNNHLNEKLGKKFNVLQEELKKMYGIIDGHGIDIDAEIKDDIKKEMQAASDYMFALSQKRSNSEVSKHLRK